jgi:hypothetical protein
MWLSGFSLGMHPCEPLPWSWAQGYGYITPIATFASFQNQLLTTNINLVFTNLRMEQFQLLNMLEQLHHIDQRPSNQSISIPNLKCVEPGARPTIVW